MLTHRYKHFFSLFTERLMPDSHELIHLYYMLLTCLEFVLRDTPSFQLHPPFGKLKHFLYTFYILNEIGLYGVFFPIFWWVGKIDLFRMFLMVKKINCLQKWCLKTHPCHVIRACTVCNSVTTCFENLSKNDETVLILILYPRNVQLAH
jgi:hypothetical protein